METYLSLNLFECKTCERMPGVGKTHCQTLIILEFNWFKWKLYECGLAVECTCTLSILGNQTKYIKRKS